MANGTIALVRTGSGYLTGQIVWSSVSNGTAANTTTVTAELQIQRSALNATTGTFKGTFTVGNTSKTISWYGTLPTYTWVTVETITATVSHNADGNGSCYLYALINGPTGTTMEGTYVSGSSTVTLDWIPRYASISAVTNFTDEGNPVITYSNPAGTAVDDLQVWLSLDGSTVLTSRHLPVTGTSYTFSLVESERNALRAATPNSNSLTVYFYVRTEISGSVFNVSTKAIMSIVNADPTISPTVVDTNSTTKSLTGNASILVALHSTASVTINAAAKKYATITSQRVQHGGAVLTGNGTFSPVTNNPIKFTVTDSRGKTRTQNATNTIIPYIDPTCAIGNNLPATDGTFELVATGLFYNGSFGAKANSLTVQYRYKAAGDSYGSWTDFGTVTKSGNSYTASASLTGLDYQTVYTFQARVIDSLHASGVNSAEKAIIAEPVFDWGKNDFRFNVPVNLKDNCDILKNGVVAYAPASNWRGTYTGDIDSTSLNGLYWLTPNNYTGTVPDDMPQYAFFDAAPRHQRLLYFGNNGITKIYERYYTNSKWYAWVRTDSIPNAMTFGTAYKTQEKWNGKEVYARTINLGTMQASGLKNHSTGVYASDNPTFISFEVYVTDGTYVHNLQANNWTAGTAYMWTNGNLWYVNVTCTASMSAYTGKALVKWVYN